MSGTYEEYLKLVENVTHSLMTDKKEAGDELVREYGALPNAMSRRQWEAIYKK